MLRASQQWIKLWALAAICLGSAREIKAQPAPPNDNFTNAQVILGVNGTVQGTNINATVQTGETGPNGAAAQSTIWYIWTAPISGTFDFNTRNSTDADGLPLETMLGVYVQKNPAKAASPANIIQIAGNVEDPSGGLTSRVDFSAQMGITYFIQVGSTLDTNDDQSQGSVTLNWGPSLVGGGFGFSTPVFLMSSLESFIPDNDAVGSITPSLYGFEQGTPNARITVTRTGGAVGRCEVTLMVAPTTYTNYYETNYYITNTYVTNFTTNGMTSADIISFTNTFVTNVAWINKFGNYWELAGGYYEMPADGEEFVTQTNFGAPEPVPGRIFTNVVDIVAENYGLPNFFTNFVCGAAPPPGLPVTNGGVVTVTVTEIMCEYSNAVPSVVPSAHNGLEFVGLTNTLVFDDYQMSQDVYLEIYPILNEAGLGPGMVDFAFESGNTFGPDDPGIPPDTNYIYAGINSLVQLTLTNAVLDPQEDPDIVPPVITETNALVDILNFWGNPAPPPIQQYVNTEIPLSVLVFNLERYADRCTKTNASGNAPGMTNSLVTVWVQRSLRGDIGAPTCHYTIDSLFPGLTVLDDNQFATVASSDYAVPLNVTGAAQTDFDFLLPTGFPVAAGGQLMFPSLYLGAMPIVIPVVENGAVEFDEDIEIELFPAPGEAEADAGITPRGYMFGYNTVGRLTINFDNLQNSFVQPGGALDRTYNYDSQNSSIPPDNTVPGANAAVNTVAIQANGMALIGGDFDAFDTTPINYLTRLQTNGFMDYSFTNGYGRGANGFINAIVIDSIGRIVIGGNFTAVNGTNANHIARLNYDGSVDATFTNGFGFNSYVYALAIDNNGNILVGGDFTQFNGVYCNHIVRLLPNGGLDPGFLPSSAFGVTNGTDADVLAVALDNFGNVIIGGDFTTINGTNWNHIGRLLTSGVVDTSFSPGFGADGDVLALAVQPDNSILIGGAFHNFNLISHNSIARLTVGGVLDPSFAPGAGFDDVVYSLALQPDGNILVGGQFTMYNSNRRVGLARVFGGQGAQVGEGGWLDTSFMDTAYNQFAGLPNHYYNTNAYNPTNYPPYNYRNQVLAIGLQADGNVVIGGSFDRVGGGYTRVDIRNRQNVARVIGTPTLGPEEGGIGNCPGNLGLTQSPYTVDDTGQLLFITLDRVNGSLGPIQTTLGTNTPPPSSSSATDADFGIESGVSLYDVVWDLTPGVPQNYGWRESDGEYGFNNNIQTVPDGRESALFLSIKNDPSAAPILYASMNLLNETGSLSEGGVPIPFGPALGQYSAGLQIINDNFPAGIIGFSATNYNVLESGSNVLITLLRTNGNYGTPSVTVNAANGTAINGKDYTWTSQQVTFNSGETSATCQIGIIDHSTQQSNKFFHIFLSSPTGGAILDTNIPPLVPSNAIVTIIDDHFQPGYLSFSSPAYNVLKPGVATISVIRSGAALGQLSAEVGTSDGTGVNGVNYVGTTNTLTWGNLDISTKTITVQTLQDNTVEGPKTVNLSLFNPLVAGVPNAEVLASPSNAVLTIQDTDSYGNLNFLTPNFNIFQNGGQALITVTRTGGLVGTVSVGFQTYTLTNVQLPLLPAVPGSNYGATNGTLTFGPGVSSQSFSVPVYQQAETNPADRVVGLELFNGSPTNVAGQFPQTAILLILDPKLHLNSAGSVDTTTQNGSGFNDVVYSLALQPDASILAGGEFTGFDSYPFDYAARLVPSGYFDTGFLNGLSGPNDTVWQVLSQTPAGGQVDGNVMIVGDFTQVNGINSARIARLDLNGVLDTSFNPGSGADGTVYAITEMLLPASTTDSTNVPYYVIGGTFANYDGNSASGVARVTPSGVLDPNFNLGVGVTGSNAAVHAIAITADNQILVGGDFTSFNNQFHHHLVRLNVDGSLDTNFSAFDGVSSDINGSIRAIVVQPDGRILIGGLFTTVNGKNFNYVARLNSDGTTDTNFNLGLGCNNNVGALALDSQLRILVGGSFTQASGVTRNGLTRLNSDGSLDPSINFGFGANGFVDSIVVQTNDEIDVAGGFSTFGGFVENNFVRLFGGANVGDGSVEFSEQVYGVLENATNAVITFQRIGGTFGAPSVSALFSTSDGTAVNGKNYIGQTNTVITFPLGETFESVQIPIIDNPIIGPDLTVNLLVTNPPSNPEAVGPQVSATLIITNVNAGVAFSAQGYRQSASAGTAIIPIVRVGNSNTTVSVTVYTGTNGSALAYTNYIPTTNTVVFYQNVITNYFLVPILNSPTTFQDTTVDLEMDDASNCVIVSPSSATLTIATSQTGPGFLTFSQTNYTVSENATNAVITVLRTNGNANTVTVKLTTSNGTAVSGVNYLGVTNLLTFQPGQNVATDNIPIIQLTNAVPNATVNLNLSDPTGGAQITGLTNEVLTIVNDIADFTFGSANYFVSEGAGFVTLSILRGGPTNSTATVYYTTYSPTNASDTNGYAVPNVDYVPTNGTLVFQPGVTLETIPVAILQGTNVNPVESFQVLLENPSPGTQVGVPGATTVGIVSDVTGFAFATNSYVVGENGTNVLVTVNRLNPNTGTFSVHFDTSDNTAVNGVDYVGTNGLLTFLDGQAANSFTVTILNPNVVEGNKTFDISLFGPSSNSYVVAPSNTVVTITNVYVGLAFSSAAYSVSECAVDAVIPVVLTGLTNSTVQVKYATANGSGVAGVNYETSAGTLTFLPGQTVAYFDVTPINNHIIGPDHTVVLNLDSPAAVTPGVAGVQLLNPSTSLLTIQECNGAFIVNSGTAFVSGSILPSTGVIYSNDTVTILFGLRDIAGGNTANLVATLQATNGITDVVTPSASYGVLIENGPTVSKPFTFTAVGSNGQNIIATLSLQDGPTNLGTVAFGFTLGGSTISFTNSGTIYLPENPVGGLTRATNSIAPGFGYPSLINVSNNPGLITKASVTLSNFGHSFPSDVDVVLEAPNGANSILMSHCGGQFTVTNLNLTFDPTASVFMPLSNALFSGTFLPTTNFLEMPKLPPVPTNYNVPVGPPQSPYPYAANLSAFQGASPNGNWSLWAMCDQIGDGGIISNGWILNLSFGVPVENDSDLQVTVNAAPAQPTVNNLLTYFVTLTNYGPSVASNVVITDYLPAGGLGYLSNSCNCGTVTNGALAISFPSLAVGAGTAFSFTVVPPALGYITNIVTALALEPDPNSNNMVTNVDLVGPTSADVGINLGGGPNPVSVGADVVFNVDVTNGGPSEASNVTAIIVLPPGFVVTSNGITASTGTTTNLSGTITWTIGSLAYSPTGSGPTLTVATTATTPGIGLCNASVTSTVYDPHKGNNFASVKIEVDAPFQPLINISLVGQTYQLTWSASATNFTLQGAVNLPPQGTWESIPPPPIVNGEYTYTLPGNNGYQFFRLISP